MWFWIALIAFLLIVFLVAKAVAHRRRGLHEVGLQEGFGVSLQGVWSNAGEGPGKPADAGDGWGGWGGWGDGGWGGGDGGGE